MTHISCLKNSICKSRKDKNLSTYKNHDMMAHCSMAAKEGNLDRLIRKYAYELRFENLSELALMLTKADLMSVKRNGAFWEKTSEEFKNISKNLKRTLYSFAIQQSLFRRQESLMPRNWNRTE